MVLKVIAKEKQKSVKLTEVFFTPEIVRNIVFFGKLERNDFNLVCGGATRVLMRARKAKIGFDVSIRFNVLYAMIVESARATRTPSVVLMAILIRESR